MLSYIQDDIYGCFTALCFTAGLSLPLKTGLTDWLYFTPGPSPTLSSTHTQATTTKQKHYVCIYTHTSTKLCFTKHHIFPNTSPHVSYMHTQTHTKGLSPPPSRPPSSETKERGSCLIGCPLFQFHTHRRAELRQRVHSALLLQLADSEAFWKVRGPETGICSAQQVCCSLQRKFDVGRKKIEVPVWSVSLFAYFKPQHSDKTAQLVRLASSHVNIFNIFRLGTKSHSSHYSWGWKTESKRLVPPYSPQTRVLTVREHGSNLKTWLS